jgi:hypothetical protein
MTKRRRKEIKMKVFNIVVCSGLAVAIGSYLTLSPHQAAGAGPNLPLPPVIEAGFDSWAKGGGADAILGGWQRGGLMEGSSKAATQAGYFRNSAQTLGTYKSHEIIQTKAVSRASQVIYLSINFERGLVYGRFLVYRTEKDWVVQNMDFSDRPEALMPWLAFEGQQTKE